MMALLPEGWVHPSGSSSAKAGMNGGFDNLCGRLVYYDGASSLPMPPARAVPDRRLPAARAEITNDFASQDSERIE